MQKLRIRSGQQQHSKSTEADEEVWSCFVRSRSRYVPMLQDNGPPLFLSVFGNKSLSLDRPRSQLAGLRDNLWAHSVS
jgi:hypothetical protein